MSAMSNQPQLLSALSERRARRAFSPAAVPAAIQDVLWRAFSVAISIDEAMELGWSTDSVMRQLRSPVSVAWGLARAVIFSDPWPVASNSPRQMGTQ